ncbi:hypothetical protein ACRS6B_14535 [Nocardia asteroides]
MFSYFAKRALVLLSISATSVAVAGPVEAQPFETIHCGKRLGTTDWQGPLTDENTHVNELFISINVGGDDIRSGTVVSAVVSFRTIWDHEKSASAVLTSDPHPNNSDFFGKVSLRSRSDDIDSLVSPSDIDKVEILYTSGQPDIFSTPDNWNMDSISVQYSQHGGSTLLEPLFSGAGEPWLHRFKADCDDASGEGGHSWTAVNPSVRWP